LSKFLTDVVAGKGQDGDKKKKKKLEEMLVVSEPKLGQFNFSSNSRITKTRSVYD